MTWDFQSVMVWAGLQILYVLVLVLQLVIQFWWQRWIENKFAQKLENYKHENARALEDVKHKINAQMDRITKFHNREYEVIPVVWENLCDLAFVVSSFVGSEDKSEVSRVSQQFLRVFQKSKIFLSPEIKDKFFAVYQLVNRFVFVKEAKSSLEKKSVRNENVDEILSFEERIFSLHGELEKSMREIDRLIQDRLYPPIVDASGDGCLPSRE